VGTLRSCNLLKFWEIIDNILETVQDRDIVTMEIMYDALNGMTANDFERA